ncbi:fimbria/pilus periplasmic chaperone (plasmid) [Deinococcus taeanensis]|uniref:fimbrial biogenesis chaperone n=1 Tax=Deinococcus taeanensis TaxID=2737050 RepID=UPI001CDD6226|nr:fimbria/pilus periplasmic chaperone [Deinococcus taeanensis]UBV44471.1 fimbria/pilus periplasmic chaperone [Deinococcus taeanensis]
MPAPQPTLLRQLLLGTAALMAGLHMTARAATFNVAPVRLEFAQQARTAAITLSNPSDQPLVIKLEVVAWTQQDGQDIYTPTTDLLVVPPIFTLAPRSTQVVRVALRRAVDPRKELSYRLYLQEVPGKSAGNGVSVQVLLRVGVPIFVQPAAAPVSSLSWQARLGSDGLLHLTAQNTGTTHVQVTHLGALGTGTVVLLDEDMSAYLLPGQTRSWSYKPRQALSPGAKFRLQAGTDAGDFSVDLTLDR